MIQNREGFGGIDADNILDVPSGSSEEADKIQEATEEHRKKMNDEMNTVQQEQQNEIAHLMSQLHSKEQDQYSIFHECEQCIFDWKEVFYALQGDQDAIRRKIQEIDNVTAMQPNITLSYFLWLDDLSEEELYRECVKYFMPQTSPYYLWWIIDAVHRKAFVIWFFSAMNGKEWKIDETFSKIIRITQKLVNIAGEKINE